MEDRKEESRGGEMMTGGHQVLNAEKRINAQIVVTEEGKENRGFVYNFIMLD